MFDLGVQETSCCHPGYPPEFCAELARRAAADTHLKPAPQIVYIEACGGRVGYLANGKPAEVTVSRPPVRTSSDRSPSRPSAR